MVHGAAEADFAPLPTSWSKAGGDDPAQAAIVGIAATVGGEALTFLADNGSATSILGAAVWERIPAAVRSVWRQRAAPAGYRLSGFIGERAEVICEVVAPVVVRVTRGAEKTPRVYSTDVRMLVVDLGPGLDGLLGRDVMLTNRNPLGVLYGASVTGVRYTFDNGVTTTGPGAAPGDGRVAATVLRDERGDVVWPVGDPESPLTYTDALDDLHDLVTERDMGPELEEVMKRCDETTPPGVLAEFRALVYEFRDVFSPLARGDKPPEGSMGVRMVDGYDEKRDAVNCGARPIAPGRIAAVVAELERLIALGIVVRAPADARWCSSLVVVPKHDGTARVCGDYVEVNKFIRPGAHVLPTVDGVLHATRGSSWFARSDMTSGYWQYRCTPEEQRLWVFRVPPEAATSLGTLLTFAAWPMGAKVAPQAFQAAVTGVLQPLMDGDGLLAYIDDQVSHAASAEELLEKVKRLLAALRGARLKLAPKKFFAFTRTASVLGELLDGTGKRQIAPERLEAWRTVAVPRNVRDLRTYLGAANFLRPAVEDLGRIIAPLHELTKPGTVLAREWGAAHDRAFIAAQAAILAAHERYVWDPALQAGVRSDASDVGYGGYLYQREPSGGERVIAFTSGKWTSAQLPWSTVDKEMFALVHVVRTFDFYLQGIPFSAKVDARNLLWCADSESPRVRRWALSLTPYDMTIEAVAGVDNPLADAASRLPVAPRATAWGGERGVGATPGTERVLVVAPAPGGMVTRSGAAAARGKEMPKPAAKAPVVGGKRGTAKKKDKRRTPLAEVGVRTGTEEEPVLTEVPRAAPLMTGDVMTRIAAAQAGAGKEEKATWRTSLGCEEKERGGHRLWHSRGDVIVPRTAEDIKSALLLACHGHGHFGVQRVRRLLKEAGVFWSRMGADIEAAVHGCHECQRHRKERATTHAGTLHASVATRPFGVWHVDYLGPLAGAGTSDDDGGAPYTHVLVCVDKFTRWVTAMACAEPTAAVSCRLLTRLMLQYGVPGMVVMDNGSHLRNGAVAALAASWGFKMHYTTSEHSASNGSVERANGTLGGLLRRLPLDRQAAWPSELEEMTWRMNTTVCRSTGVTPFKALYGLDARTQVAAAVRDEAPHYASVEEHWSEAERVRSGARFEQVKAAAAAALHHDKGRASGAGFPLGTRVWVRVKKRGTKWAAPQNKGPYKVMEKVNDVTYVVEHAGTGHTRKAHVEQMTVVDEGLGEVPADEDERDGVYNVEVVLAHRQRKGGEREYLVKWVDYGLEHNSWLKEDAFVEGNVLLQVYRTARGLTS